MKRSDKILRLVAVGFGATELSHMSNEVLGATYESAKPRMKAHADELARVMERERKHGDALKRKIADRQRNEQIEVRWASTWQPPKPIIGIKQVATERDSEITTIRHMIKRASKKAEEDGELFRQSGDQAYARSANEARQAIIGLTELLKDAEGVKS